MERKIDKEKLQKIIDDINRQLEEAKKKGVKVPIIIIKRPKE